MEDIDRTKIAELVNFIWGPGTITRNEINDQVVEVVSEALIQTRTCSDSMDLVPRPPSGPANVKWALKQVKKAAKRMLKKKDSRVYNICKVGVAFKWRRALELAKYGEF